MKFEIKVLSITFGLALAANGLLHWERYAMLSRLSVATLIGELCGATLALWGISGIAAVFSKPENKLKNWIILMIFLAVMLFVGNRFKAQEESQWHETKSGNRYRLVK